MEISQPRTQVCSRYPSDQRRFVTERDSARRPRRTFPTSLTGDVTSEIVEDDWNEAGDLVGRYPTPFSISIILQVIRQPNSIIVNYALGSAYEKFDVSNEVTRISYPDLLLTKGSGNFFLEGLLNLCPL